MKIEILEVERELVDHDPGEAGLVFGAAFLVCFSCSLFAGKATFITSGGSTTPPTVGKNYWVEPDFERISSFDLAGVGARAKAIARSDEGDFDVIGQIARISHPDLVEVVVGKFVADGQTFSHLDDALCLTLLDEDTGPNNFSFGDMVSFRLHGLRLYDVNF